MRCDRMKSHKPRRTQTRPHPQRRIPVTARQVALVVLDSHKRTARFVSHLIDDEFVKLARETIRPSQPGPSNSPGDQIDRRWVTEVVCGVVRRQATLNALIQPHVQRPRNKVEGALWTLLQLGTYQLVFMRSIPAHAAVHETVELAGWWGKPRWAGFLNGVLRAIARNLTDETVGQAASDAVPLSAGEFLRLRQQCFPDPRTDWCGYVSRAFSFPRRAIEHWQQRFDPDELTRLGFWFNTPPRICLRVNRLKTNRETLVATLSEELRGHCPSQSAENHVTVWPDNDRPAAVWSDSSRPLVRLRQFQDGWFSVQDPSAMAASELLAPESGETVLDLCAGLGTKTTHLAELMDDRGKIIATDIRNDCLALIADSCRRLGISIVETQPIHSDGADVPSGPFDAILVDVPCSNTGVLGKRPEARWRLVPGHLKEMVEAQKQLLETALCRLKMGGRVVYSTCSIEPEENGGIVQAALARHPHIECAGVIEHRPGRPGDGAYQALLRRVL